MKASKHKQMNKRTELLQQANKQTDDRPNSKIWSWYNVFLFPPKQKSTILCPKKWAGRREKELFTESYDGHNQKGNISFWVGTDTERKKGEVEGFNGAIKERD